MDKKQLLKDLRKAQCNKHNDLLFARHVAKYEVANTPNEQNIAALVTSVLEYNGHNIYKGALKYALKNLGKVQSLENAMACHKNTKIKVKVKLKDGIIKVKYKITLPAICGEQEFVHKVTFPVNNLTAKKFLTFKDVLDIYIALLVHNAVISDERYKYETNKKNSSLKSLEVFIKKFSENEKLHKAFKPDPYREKVIQAL